jgi:membrane-associated phospholipid phosphatase
MGAAGRTPSDPEPLVAWPAWRQLRITGSLALGFALFWLVVYGGASVLSRRLPFRFAVHMDWEPRLPFVPELAPVYLSLNLMLLILLLVLRTWRQVVPVLAVLGVETLVAAACFLVLPIEDAFPAAAVTGPPGLFFVVADTLNLAMNYWPSLHVAYAFTAALVIGRRAGSLAGVVGFTWAGAVAVSTMLLHQHYLADVVAGIALAWLTMRGVYERAAAPGFLRAVRVEAICLGEIYRFSRRHLRYLLIAVIIYRYSLGRWRARRPIRVGFCFLQHVDDLLDGDRPSSREPTEVADDVLAQLERGAFDESPLGALARCLWEDMARFRTDDEDPRGELLALIRLMRRDRVRAREHQLLSPDDLREHLRQTFHHAVNLMLILGGAEARAADAPDLVEAFGWCSTVRDLDEDLAKGLVNIPAPLVEAARGQGVLALNATALRKAPAVRQWLGQEYARAIECLARADAQLARLEGKRGAAILRLFHRSILRRARQWASADGWPSPAATRARPVAGDAAADRTP